jgi:hypothetical protein
MKSNAVFVVAGLKTPSDSRDDRQVAEVVKGHFDEIIAAEGVLCCDTGTTIAEIDSLPDMNCGPICPDALNRI